MPWGLISSRAALASALSVALLLSAGCSVFRHRGGGSTAVIAQGVAADRKLGVRVTASGAEGVPVRFAGEPRPPAATLLGFAVTRGQAVSVAPQRQLADAVLRLSFDPAADMPSPDPGRPAYSVANAFIATYNTDAQAWLPLPTTYDASSHELSASTTHFSLFMKMVVRPYRVTIPNPLKTVGSAVASGVSATVDLVNTVATTGWDALMELGYEIGHSAIVTLQSDDVHGIMQGRNKADCGHGRAADGAELPDAAHSTSVSAKGWNTVVDGAHSATLKACVADDPGGTNPQRWLRLENYNGYPIMVFSRRGLTSAAINDYDARMLNDDLFLLMHRYQAANFALTAAVAGLPPSSYDGFGVGNGLRSTELRVLTKRDTFDLTVTADPIAIAIQVIMGLLIVLPGVGAAKAALMAAERRTILALNKITPAGEHYATETVVAKIKDDPELRKTPLLLQQGSALLSLWTCLSNTKNTLLDVSPVALFKAVRGCASFVAKAFKSEVGSFVAGVFSNAKLANELGDFWKHARSPARVRVVAPALRNQLGGVDWLRVIGPRLGCGTHVEMYTIPVEHDITGDGTPDTFVTLDCYTGNSSYPDHVEVYDGASSPAAPRLLGVLTNDVALHLSAGCMTFGRNSVTLHGHVHADGDPAGLPSLIGIRTAHWTGGAMHVGPMTVRPATEPGYVHVPGC
jgi:hypothetical protein